MLIGSKFKPVLFCTHYFVFIKFQYFLYCIVSLFDAVKRNFVFQIGNCIPQTEVELQLEKVVGHKVTKHQIFDAVQTLGKIEKKTIRVGDQKDGCDNRKRMYPNIISLLNINITSHTCTFFNLLYQISFF